MYTNLRKLMVEKGVTVEQLAKMLWVHRNTVQNKLDGESKFTFGQAAMIADLVFPEYKPSYLFKRSA